jgi:hypothetical protein
MKLTKTLFFALTLLNIANATPTGKELTHTKCVSCHSLNVPSPESIPTLTAPPFHSVLFHIKEAINDKKAQEKFIVNFALNPNVTKSVCESNQVQKFGLMPSQKGLVTEKELELIAEHLTETYPSKEFVEMISTMQTNDKMRSLKNSPFLMNQSELPHLTKLLIEDWDKEKLSLTPEQKEKLLVVRKETISGIKKIKKALKPLEAEVIDMTADEDVTLKEIQPKIDAISKLKNQASMIHVKCLKESVAILNEKQIAVLLPLWDM